MMFIYTIIGLLFLIMIHELGHFLVGLWLKVPIAEFAVGMGPKIFSKKIKGIEYSLRLFPIGGYCSFASKENGSVINDDLLESKPPLTRFLVGIAGCVFNIVSAFIIYFVTMIVYKGFSLDLISQMISAFYEFVLTCVDAIKMMFTQVPTFENTTGYIGLSNMVSSSVQEDGFIMFWLILVLFDILLAIFNILPIPCLDGWMALESIIEMITKKKLPEKVEMILRTCVWSLIMILTCVVLFHDVVDAVNMIMTLG